jgi:hypothetical protein
VSRLTAFTRKRSPAVAGLLGFGPLLWASYFLLEPEPDDELGDVLWFALG